MMNKTTVVFAIEEYKALRAEIIERSKIDHAIQRNAMLVTGAVSSFVFAREPDPSLALVLLVIPLVLLVAHFQQARHKAYGMRIGRYLSKIEKYMYSELAEQLKEGDIGWEHFLAEERRKETDIGSKRGEKGYWDEVIESLRGKGYSLSATVVDARYLTIGAAVFFFVAAGYLVFTLMNF